MVLEPWITPSLFYQFLGKDETSTGLDMHSFCQVLGPEEGNRQLQRHWKTWVTEDIIQKLAASGAVNSLRLPVGDWMYKPYGPYVGCTDGALDHVDYVLDWAYENGLSVLIDIHGVKGSQNGFDNSGQSMGFEWTSVLNTVPAGDVTFEHWPIRSAGWMGDFDNIKAEYTSINYDNIQHALDVIEAVVTRYADHPAVLGLEPVNEPWQYTPIDHLKKFYWDGYLIVKEHAPYWKYIMHDSFRLDPNVWRGFMRGCPDRALDTHIYQAWNDPGTRETFYANACQTKHIITEMEIAFGPVVVGEWSLATDNCAMWLNGFNDNLSGFPRLPCKYIPCAEPYMGTDQPGTPVDPAKGVQGPFGTGMSGPSFGMCPVGRDWLKLTKDTADMNLMLHPPTAPEGYDDTDEVMTQLALKKINSFSGFGHGFYFWNFRTDVYEPRWSYMAALERGWIPNGNLNDEKITTSCLKEDNGLYECITKPGQLDSVVQGNVEYVIQSQGPTTDLLQNITNITIVNGVVDTSIVKNITGANLTALADRAYNEYWQKNRVKGATCDFGGTATLVEINRTYTDMSNETEVIIEPEKLSDIQIAEITALIMLSIFVGGFLGFCTAMRCNKGFKRQVSRSSFGATLKRNSVLSRSFGLDPDFEYEPVRDIPSYRDKLNSKGDRRIVSYT